ncbi:MAG: tetratricopeptide repeat protein [Acidobacteria bacterium]|nr:tetratricopeptide repeat protein [Acidobacteriota bacterium]
MVVAALALALGCGAGGTAPGLQLPALPDTLEPEAVRIHLTDADHAARANRRSAEAVGALGLAYHADLYYDRAIESYALAEALDPDEWRWTHYRAMAHVSRGDAERAREALVRVVESAPDIAPAWWRLGDVAFKTGRRDEATRAWRRVMELPEPATPPAAATAGHTPLGPLAAYAAFGLARLHLDDSPAQARELLEGATGEAPRFGPAFRLLGDAYAALGRDDDATRARRRAAALPRFAPYVDEFFQTLIDESRSAAFLLQQASTADLTTNGAWREHLVRRALAVDPDNRDALFELATMLRVERRYGEALELLERHRRLFPGDPQVVADIGRCLSALRQYAAAEPLLREAMETLDTSETRYDLALVLDRSGRLDEAVAEYERALDRNPNHVDALINLGIALARQGELVRATRLFERAATVDPEHADAQANLGALYLAEGAREAARQAFEQALEIDPGHAGAAEGLRQLGPR